MLPRAIYPLLFFLALAALPVVAIASSVSVLEFALSGLFLVVWYGLNLYYYRSLDRPEIGLFDLFNVATNDACSGCFNLTILYIWIPLFYWYGLGWWYILSSRKDASDPSAKFAGHVLRRKQPGVYFPDKRAAVPPRVK